MKNIKFSSEISKFVFWMTKEEFTYTKMVK